MTFTQPNNSSSRDYIKPNYQKIEKNIQDKNSNLFYESLLEGYLEGDATMTLQKKRHLYYGYIFQEAYAPYGCSEYSFTLNTVLQKEELTPTDYAEIIDLTDKILVDIPFDLKSINYQLYALEQTGNKDAFTKRTNQLQSITDAMISSGNGKSKDTAFYVIYTSHEYDLSNILGFEFGGTQQLLEPYDYLSLKENDANLKGLYFDISPCLKTKNNIYKL